MLSFWPRLAALIVAALMLLPATGVARVLHVCGVMGTVTNACCCAKMAIKGSAPAADDSRQTSIQRAACCHADVEGTSAPPAGVVPISLELPVAALPIMRAEPTLQRASRTSRVLPPARSRAPPPPGPPLYIKHRALLN